MNYNILGYTFDRSGIGRYSRAPLQSEGQSEDVLRNTANTAQGKSAQDLNTLEIFAQGSYEDRSGGYTNYILGGGLFGSNYFLGGHYENASQSKTIVNYPNYNKVVYQNTEALGGLSYAQGFNVFGQQLLLGTNLEAKAKTIGPDKNAYDRLDLDLGGTINGLNIGNKYLKNLALSFGLDNLSYFENLGGISYKPQTTFGLACSYRDKISSNNYIGLALDYDRGIYDQYQHMGVMGSYQWSSKYVDVVPTLGLSKITLDPQINYLSYLTRLELSKRIISTTENQTSKTTKQMIYPDSLLSYKVRPEVAKQYVEVQFSVNAKKLPETVDVKFQTKTYLHQEFPGKITQLTEIIPKEEKEYYAVFEMPGIAVVTSDTYREGVAVTDSNGDVIYSGWEKLCRRGGSCPAKKIEFKLPNKDTKYYVFFMQYASGEQVKEYKKQEMSVEERKKVTYQIRQLPVSIDLKFTDRGFPQRGLVYDQKKPPLKISKDITKDEEITRILNYLAVQNKNIYAFLEKDYSADQLAKVKLPAPGKEPLTVKRLKDQLANNQTLRLISRLEYQQDQKLWQEVYTENIQQVLSLPIDKAVQIRYGSPENRVKLNSRILAEQTADLSIFMKKETETAKQVLLPETIIWGDFDKTEDSVINAKLVVPFSLVRSVKEQAKKEELINEFMKVQGKKGYLYELNTETIQWGETAELLPAETREKKIKYAQAVQFYTLDIGQKTTQILQLFPESAKVNIEPDSINFVFAEPREELKTIYEKQETKKHFLVDAFVEQQKNMGQNYFNRALGFRFGYQF